MAQLYVLSGRTGVAYAVVSSRLETKALHTNSLQCIKMRSYQILRQRRSNQDCAHVTDSHVLSCLHAAEHSIVHDVHILAPLLSSF